MKGAIYGLNLSHTQAHIYRAILEGVAYSIRENVEVLNAMDISVKSVRVVAGGGREQHVARHYRRCAGPSPGPGG